MDTQQANQDRRTYKQVLENIRQMRHETIQYYIGQKLPQKALERLEKLARFEYEIISGIPALMIYDHPNESEVEMNILILGKMIESLENRKSERNLVFGEHKLLKDIRNLQQQIIVQYSE